MRKLLIIAAATLTVVVGGCTKWLDVEANDRILEKDAYSTEVGIDNVLNGLYRTMTGDELYGYNMTVGTVDFLAHYFDFPTGDLGGSKRILYNMSQLGIYAYNEDRGNETRETYIAPIWENGYKFILAVNTFIKNLEAIENEDVISRERRDLYLGEAYGLRAMMHLDLYRLFGPITPEGDDTVLPYHVNALIETTLYVTANEFLGYVMDDIDTATELLERTDPAFLEERVFDHHDDDNDMTPEERFAKAFRNKRMNYWAVQVLRARTHMLLGTDSDLQQVIAITENILTDAVDPSYTFKADDMQKKDKPFAWTPSSGYVGNNEILYDEVIFGATKPELKEWWISHFGMTGPSEKARAVIEVNLRNNIFGDAAYVMDNNVEDRRVTFWSRMSLTAGSVGSNAAYGYWANNKYSGKSSLYPDTEKYLDFKVNNMISLIRLSEVQYMNAEARMKTGDLPGAITSINSVMARHGMQPSQTYYAMGLLPLGATEANFKEMLRREYYREFVMEGQTFYYLKRNNEMNMIRGTASGNLPAAQWSGSKYVLPLPEDETDFLPDDDKDNNR